MDDTVTSLVMNIEGAEPELRSDIYMSYMERSINLTELLPQELSDYGIRRYMNGCGYRQDLVQLLFEFSDDISIYVNGNSTDQMASCVAYVDAIEERARQNKIHEVERRLWDERMQPDIDEDKRRKLKSDDF